MNEWVAVILSVTLLSVAVWLSVRVRRLRYKIRERDKELEMIKQNGKHIRTDD